MLHRAEMLAHCAAGARLLAVAGTSGKTTTTAMLGWILTEAGLDPTVVNGGAVTAWRGADRTGSVRRGPSDLWVVEVDESDRSLLRFTPEWAVITNISRDHFPLPETIRLFQDFAARVRREIVCFPDAADLLALPPDRVVTAEDEAGVFAGPAGDELRIAGETVRVPLPGRHNLENAALAARLALRVGAAPAAVRTALARFPGVARRLEMVAPPARGVRVLDDYGHNPAKISAAWRAAAADARRVLGVWRPHGFRPLAEMMDDLADAFAAVCRPEDELFLLPVFFAGGTVVRSADSGELAERLRARGARARTVAGYDELRKALLDALRPGDTALIMGARDPELPRFARALAADWAAR